LFLALAPSSAWAAADTQSYTVNVTAVLTITAPSAASVTHDATDANQVFSSQSWTIACNDPQGGSLTFAVSSPFTHTTVGTYKADTKLVLAISSSESAASWSLGTSTDQTDYSNATPDNAATVSASSTGAGNAVFGLTVTFVQADYSILANGAYSVTVTGTLTAN
jgi:hypothetical protein